MHEGRKPCRAPGHGQRKLKHVFKNVEKAGALVLLKIICGDGFVARKGFIVGCIDGGYGNDIL